VTGVPNDEERPEKFRVAVLIRHRSTPPEPWLSDSWQVIGVVVHNRAESVAGRVRVRSDPGGEDYLWVGLSLRLFKDELESYYYNLTSNNPSLYVISLVDDQGVLQPFRVSACFDEANACSEAGHHVEAVPMPPELYRWVESYVLTHYLPEPRRQRKRRDWKAGDHEQG
jgi:hypothetical protein